jgi:hypothetical protein
MEAQVPIRGPSETVYTRFDAAKVYLNSVKSDVIFRKIQSA